MIPPSECLLDPEPRDALAPPVLPPLVAADPNVPLTDVRQMPHWVSRAERGERLAADMLTAVDRILGDAGDRDKRTAFCAAWARRVAEEQGAPQ